MAITVEIFETGTIQIRPSQLTQPIGPVLQRRLKFLTDRQWTDPIPIYAFLIRHPEGNVLFDLGETPKCVQAGYYNWWQIGHHCVNMHIQPDRGLSTQLKAIGVDPQKDVHKVVLSHLHSDHAGALPDVHGGPPVYTSAAHWEAFKSPFWATIEGANPAAWPTSFRPSILEASGPAIGPWSCSYPITQDGKIVAVDTPGHVPGHLSLIVFDDECTYFLTGDACYSLDLLDKEMVDGICSQPAVALDSQRKIKEFCRSRPVVVLPSHDFASRRILATKEVFRPT